MKIIKVKPLHHRDDLEQLNVAFVELNVNIICKVIKIKSVRVGSARDLNGIFKVVDYNFLKSELKLQSE